MTIDRILTGADFGVEPSEAKLREVVGEVIEMSEAGPPSLIRVHEIALEVARLAEEVVLQFFIRFAEAIEEHPKLEVFINSQTKTFLFRSAMRNKDSRYLQVFKKMSTPYDPYSVLLEFSTDDVKVEEIMDALRLILKELPDDNLCGKALFSSTRLAAAEENWKYLEGISLLAKYKSL